MSLLQPLLTFERVYNRLTPISRGRYAGTRLIGWGIGRLGLKAPTLHGPYGVRLTYVPRIAHDCLVRDTVLTGGFEELECDILRSLTPAGGGFIDVGANIGYFALMASSWVGPQGRVLAVEPVPETFGLLAENIALNQASNLTPINAACAAHPGRQGMVLDADSGRSHLAPNGSGATIVSVTTVDELVAEHRLERVDVIMTDVEGADFQVIQGARETIRQHRPAVWLETLWLPRYDSTVAEVVAFMECLDYSCLEMISQRSTDLLCLPNP